MGETFNCLTRPCPPCRVGEVAIGKFPLVNAIDLVRRRQDVPEGSRIPADLLINAAMRAYDIPIPNAKELIQETLAIGEEMGCTPRPTVQ